MFRGVLVALLLVELAGIGWLVLNPSPATPTTAVFDLSAWFHAHGIESRATQTDVVEFGLNVLLFIPLGLLLSLLFSRVPLAVWMMVGIALSGALETLQLEFLPARSASAQDFAANTIGMFIGAGSVALVRWTARRVSQVRRWRRGRVVLVGQTGDLVPAEVPEAVPEPLG